MTTKLHQSTIDHYVDRGCKTEGAREFVRLAFYLTEELSIAGAHEILTDFYESGVAINKENATRVASSAQQSLPDGDLYASYSEVRADAPAPRGIPDAWAYREAPEEPGRGCILFVEVFDTKRTSIDKIAGYAGEMDALECIEFELFEVGANDGTVVQHDPSHALMLCLYHDVQTGRSGAPLTREVRQAYAEHIRGGALSREAA